MALRPGKCLLTLRLKQAGITQIELSERIGISQPMLSHYANKRKIMSLTNAKIIADALSVSIEELYTWDQSPAKRRGH